MVQIKFMYDNISLRVQVSRAFRSTERIELSGQSRRSSATIASKLAKTAVSPNPDWLVPVGLVGSLWDGLAGVVTSASLGDGESVAGGVCVAVVVADADCVGVPVAVGDPAVAVDVGVGV